MTDLASNAKHTSGSINLTAAQASDLFRRPPDKYLDVGSGAEVAYRRIGTGPDVLFVHGWPVSGATFRTLLPHLADQVTCHLIDLPGAGSSRWTADTPLSIASHIAAVRSVVDQLGFDSVAVVGHDSGGLIARHALAGDPRLRALGLIDTEQTSGPSWRFRTFTRGPPHARLRRVPRLGRETPPAPSQPIRLRRSIHRPVIARRRVRRIRRAATAPFARTSPCRNPALA